MRTLSIVIVLAMADAAGAGTRVVAMVDPDDVGALRVALAGREIDLAVTPAPGGDLRLDRAALAQRSAVDQRADATVWIENEPGSAEVWVVSANGRQLGHAPLPIEDGSPRVFAAIATSLLDEVLAPPAPPPMAVDVHVDLAPLPARAPAIASAPSNPHPHYMLDAGGFVSKRGMVFDGLSTGGRQVSYPASAIDGMRAEIAAFPQPVGEHGDRMTGPGITASYARSVGAQLTASDVTGQADFAVNHTEWQLAAHYRYPVGTMTFGGALEVGNIATEIVDLAADVHIPDTSYTYVGGALHVDLAVARHASVGFGAHYMALVKTGDITAMDWYGAATGYGYAVDAGFVMHLPDMMYVKGAVEYRAEHLDFEGIGAVAVADQVYSVDDTTIAGTAAIGVAF